MIGGGDGQAWPLPWKCVRFALFRDCSARGPLGDDEELWRAALVTGIAGCSGNNDGRLHATSGVLPDHSHGRMNYVAGSSPRQDYRRMGTGVTRCYLQDD